VSFVSSASFTKPNTRWPSTASGIPTAAANDDVLLGGHEPELISLAAPHQIAGMVPTRPDAFRGRLRIVPVAVEDVCAADQEFSGLSVCDNISIFVDQPDQLALWNSHNRSWSQAEGPRSNHLRCTPDVVEGCAKS
jgi:hypothetical protein